MEFIDKLKRLGANDFIFNKIKDIDLNKYKIARVFYQHSNLYHAAVSTDEIILSFPSGKLKKRIKSMEELPVAGDWIVVENKNTTIFPIIKVIERFSRLSRKHPYRDYKQVIAANIDIVFITISADRENFTTKTIKKYLNTVIKNNLDYRLIVNKIDLLANYNDIFKTIDQLEIERKKVILLDSRNIIGYDALKNELLPFKTSLLFGHSGAGKSTIINNLCGKNVRKTREVNPKTLKGRQTTTSRELIILDNNHIIIDIPGINFLEDDIDYDKIKVIEETGEQCKFRDCKHISEPGCMVRKAVEEGKIDKKIYTEYIRLIKNEKV